MTVQELITELQKFNPETEVMIEFTDHTDWMYKSPITPGDVYLGDQSCGGGVKEVIEKLVKKYSE